MWPTFHTLQAGATEVHGCTTLGKGRCVVYASPAEQHATMSDSKGINRINGTRTKPMQATYTCLAAPVTQGNNTPLHCCFVSFSCLPLCLKPLCPTHPSFPPCDVFRVGGTLFIFRVCFWVAYMLGGGRGAYDTAPAGALTIPCACTHPSLSIARVLQHGKIRPRMRALLESLLQRRRLRHVHAPKLRQNV